MHLRKNEFHLVEKEMPMGEVGIFGENSMMGG